MIGANGGLSNAGELPWPDGCQVPFISRTNSSMEYDCHMGTYTAVRVSCYLADFNAVQCHQCRLLIIGPDRTQLHLTVHS